jgi:hypothetical protein
LEDPESPQFESREWLPRYQHRDENIVLEYSTDPDNPARVVGFHVKADGAGRTELHKAKA